MELTFVDAIRQALIEEMRRDPAVFLMGEDIGVYGGAFKATAGLVDEFGPQRVIDTPLAESAIVGAAIGASYTGMRPVVEMQFMDFVACCFNQITNFAAKSHYRWNAPVPIVIRGPVGGGVHGGPFHSQNPEMYFVHTPGLDHQLRRQEPLSLERSRADRDSRTGGRRRARRPLPFPESRDVFRAYAGSEGSRARDAWRRLRLAAGGHPRQQPRLVPRAQVPLSPAEGRRGDRCPADPARAREGRAAGARPLGDHLWRHGANGAGHGRPARRPRHRS